MSRSGPKGGKRSNRRTDEGSVTEEFGDKLHDLVSLVRCDDIEASILGAVLFDPTLWYAVEGHVVREDFGNPRHAVIFDVIRELIESGRAVDIGTVVDRLGPRVDAIGGPQYLHQILAETGTGAYVETWVRVLAEKAAARRIQRGGIDVLMSIASGAEYDEVLASVSKLHETASKSSAQEGLEDIQSVLMDVFSHIENSVTRTGVTGRSTGLRDLTAALGGLSDGQLIVLGARPAMGKTSALLQAITAIAEEALARGEKGVVCGFSLEMPKREMGQREIAQVARVSESKIRQGKLSQDDVTALTEAANKVALLPVLIADAIETVEGIRAACHRARLKHGKVLAVAIDYLQLVEWMGAFDSYNREQRVSGVSKRLKMLAKELGCPVIALAQLSRKCEERPNKRPMLSDLREAGGIEQDADVVMFLYRDEVYNRNTDDRGIAEFIIAKQRHGSTGTVRVMFFGAQTRFADLKTAEEGLRDFSGEVGAGGAMGAGDGGGTVDDVPPDDSLDPP